MGTAPKGDADCHIASLLAMTETHACGTQNLPPLGEVPPQGAERADSAQALSGTADAAPAPPEGEPYGEGLVTG